MCILFCLIAIQSEWVQREVDKLSAAFAKRVQGMKVAVGRRYGNGNPRWNILGHSPFHRKVHDQM